MYLEMDMGNTRTKWRIRDSCNVLERGFFDTGASPKILEPVLGPYVKKLHGIWIANVASKELECTIKNWAQIFLHRQPIFARSRAVAAGVKNAYSEPDRLGVDRWLCMLAAYQLTNRASIVLSLGTAATIDMIDNNGKHLGGFIGPGLALMARALTGGTNRIEFNPGDIILSTNPGQSTSSGICAGCTSMLCGLVDNAVKQLCAVIGDEPFELIFTGGDAIRLMPFYPSARLINELVLDGLVYAMQDEKPLE